MRAIVLLPLLTLGLAACAETSPTPMATTVPTPAVNAPVQTSVSANPPDHPTGSVQYQSPDTDAGHTTMMHR